MSKKSKVAKNARHDVAKTSRPDTPELEGGIPLPEELTGRASATSEDLVTLFDRDSADHIADGFRGGSDEDADSDLVQENNTDPDAGDDVTAI